MCLPVTFGVQESLDAQVLLGLTEGVLQPVDRRRLLLHRAPIEQLRPGKTAEGTFGIACQAPGFNIF